MVDNNEKRCRVAKEILEIDLYIKLGIGDAIGSMSDAKNSLINYKMDDVAIEIMECSEKHLSPKKVQLQTEQAKLFKEFNAMFENPNIAKSFWDRIDDECAIYKWWYE